MTAEDQNTLDSLMELKQLLQTENEHLYQQYNHLMIRNQKLMKRIDDQQALNDKMQERIVVMEQIIDRLREGNKNPSIDLKPLPEIASIQSSINMKQLIERWTNLAGEKVKNKPTKTRQMQILALLFQHQQMSSIKLFQACNITGVSGARYIAALKQFGLIAFSGFRKGGFYYITDKGKKLIEEDIISS
jgi:predicted transcriptional regulator